MKGVETAKPGAGSERCRVVEQLPVEPDLVDARQLAPGMDDGGRSAGGDGTNDLDASKGARDPTVLATATEESPQRLRFVLPLHELDQRRGVQIEPQRSSARIAVSVSDASIP